MYGILWRCLDHGDGASPFFCWGSFFISLAFEIACCLGLFPQSKVFVDWFRLDIGVGIGVEGSPPRKTLKTRNVRCSAYWERVFFGFDALCWQDVRSIKFM